MGRMYYYIQCLNDLYIFSWFCLTRLNVKYRKLNKLKISLFDNTVTQDII